MDIRKIFVFFMVFALLMVAGCKTQQQGKTVSQATPYIGGSTGLIAKFIDGAPPDQIFDADQYPFGISVQLENKGESPLPISDTDEYIEIMGLNPEDFGKESQDDLKNDIITEEETTIEPAKKNFDGSISPGGQTVIGFDELKYAPDMKGDTDVLIRANICYNYMTETTTKICLKEDLMDTENAPAICKVSGDKKTDNSGAPIHITSFKEAPIGTKKVQFSFVIGAVGDAADSFFAVSEDICDDKITNQARYAVFVDTSPTTINGKYLDCEGFLAGSTSTGDCGGSRCSGFVRLFDKKPRILSCTLDTSDVKSTFEKAIQINLVYKYMQSIEKRVIIKDVSTSGQSDT